MVYIDKNQVTLKDLVKLKRKEYKRFTPVNCYMLKETVYFTFDGFEHLHMDGKGHRRTTKSAYSRLLLMEYAPSIIMGSRFIKEDAPKMKRNKIAVHYEVYGKVGRNDMPVVVTLRKIGEGRLHFYGIRYKRKRPQK